MDSRLTSFPPVADKCSAVLILGSMPGRESLRQQQYYAHKNNPFWRILFELYGREWTGDYGERIAFLHEHQIALWDILKHCEREGSLDRDIRNEVPNDLPGLLNTHPGIRRIFCNGRKAFSSLKRHYPEIPENLPCVILPSTSPAHAVPFDEKREQWKCILRQ